MSTGLIMSFIKCFVLDDVMGSNVASRSILQSALVAKKKWMNYYILHFAIYAP